MRLTFAFSAMTNLIVAAVPNTQTGSAVTSTPVTRAIGSALGSQVIASVLAASAIGGAATSEGFRNAFYVAAAVALSRGRACDDDPAAASQRCSQ